MGKSNERKTGSNARTLGRILRYIRPYGGLVPSPWFCPS